MKKKVSRLVLERETIRVLSDVSLAKAGGGAVSSEIQQGCTDTVRLVNDGKR